MLATLMPDGASWLRCLTRRYVCVQTWAHPKFGDRLDVGMVRQIEDGIDALEVRPSSALLLTPHLPRLRFSESCKLRCDTCLLLGMAYSGHLVSEGCHYHKWVTDLRRSSKARSQRCHASLGGRR